MRAILDRDQSAAFLDSFASLARRAALLGALNSLTQLVLKATMPGVPDFYQGTETWDLSLVDPDNRRPVDFGARQAVLAASAEPDWVELASHWTDGRIKLALTHRLLPLRKELPALFRDGTYEPVEVTGPHRDQIVAFRRSSGRNRVVVAAARHFAGMTDHRHPLAGPGVAGGTQFGPAPSPGPARCAWRRGATAKSGNFRTVRRAAGRGAAELSDGFIWNLVRLWGLSDRGGDP